MSEDMAVLKQFEDISNIFKTMYLQPLWKKYDLNEPLAATMLFLEGYAFERQGRSPAFSPAAIEAIKMADRIKNPKDFPIIVWDNFRDLLDNKGLNLKLNPLYPQYPLFHPTDTCNCIWCVLKSCNIIETSKNALAEGQTKAIWNQLKRIQGVGPKIASLFLRDVAIYYENELNLADKNRMPADDRYLLQPIDIWVHRIVVALNRQDMDEKTKYEDVAKWIVDNCSNPECCNQGMWYFGAKIAKTEFMLEKCLADPHTIERHIMELKASAQAILDAEL